jgi:GntP family gluconate:H+ symporter
VSPTLQTLVPVVAGITVVLVTILVFRLHAFFALLLAAATTAALTPQHELMRGEIRKRATPLSALAVIEERGGQGIDTILLDHSARAEFTRPDRYLVFPADPLSSGGIPKATLMLRRESAGRSSIDRYDVEPAEAELALDDLVIASDQLHAANQNVFATAPRRIASAFGDTVGSIGLLIAFAAVIGMCLLDSGGADRIVRSALSLVGERGAPLAFAFCGFLLGVPVFFDTVFLLMIPLGKAMRLRTGRNYVLYVLTIVCGATMAHSLVPPTPGPLLVAEKLGVDIGLMIVVGAAVGLVTASYGILHAWLMNKLIDVPVRDTPEMPLKELERFAARPDHELPPLWLSLLPIIVPVWLIAQQTALSLFLKTTPSALAAVAEQIPAWFVTTVNVLGEKNTAVGLGVAIGLFLLAWQTRQSLSQMRDRVAAALSGGGLIILITAAGGAFGEMLQQTGVATLLREMPTLGPAGLLTVAFLVTTAIRTAQGSATVAMITAVGLFAGIELPFNAVWLALAIGCGSKPISWMTDSGFWVICKMSGMTEVETLKTLTPMTAMMGLVGLLAVIAGAMFFPMN